MDDGALAERLERIRREQDRLVDQLRAGERRYRRLARSVWSVQESERRRLARELHDGLGQILTALKQQLEVALRKEDPGVREERIERALELASGALEDTRELSRLLRPSVLDDLGLAPALRWLARTQGESAGIEVELSCRGIEERLSDEVETLVFRVAQEALTNAVKHGEAGRAVVEVEREAGGLRIVVSDDGRGFDLEDLDATVGAGRGIGLRGMRDRVELFGGRLEIDARSGEGTRIEATIPPEELS